MTTFSFTQTLDEIAVSSTAKAGLMIVVIAVAKAAGLPIPYEDAIITALLGLGVVGIRLSVADAVAPTKNLQPGQQPKLTNPPAPPILQ